ncbi:MAG TPA: cytidylate kinase-like family protein [Vicinamibacteria bacterium]|nr:cytidylate kinase-like family protein [Vicinamibacteria bacterium]
MTRTIEALVEEQAHRWQLERADHGGEARRPVITVSRQHGARGGEVARQLAVELGLELYDREILHRIAESAHLSERVVAALDEKTRDLLTDWLTAVTGNAYLSPAEYHAYLRQVIAAVAERGGAVILGRGAHLILGEGRALRVLVVAPLEARVRTVQEREGLAERDARRRIVEVESERRAFLLKHFHTDFGDAAGFDVVVNTVALGVSGAVRSIEAALAGAPAAGRTAQSRSTPAH